MATARKPETPPETPPPDEGLVATIRSVLGEALEDLFGSGKADVEDKADGQTKADPESRTWTAREIQEAAAAEMRRVQDELRGRKSRQQKEQPPEGGASTPPPSPPAPAPTNPKSWRHKLWGTPT